MALNKKGVTTITLIFMVFFAIVLLVILGLMVWGFTIFDESISSVDDFQVGNLSFQQVYNETLKLGVEEMKTNVPQNISMGVLLGMIICLLFVAYSTEKIGRLWIILDIAFIVIAEILASVISGSFVDYINLNPELLAIYSTTLLDGASFVINLPKIIPIVGMLIMLATYIVVGKKKEDPLDF